MTATLVILLGEEPPVCFTVADGNAEAVALPITDFSVAGRVIAVVPGTDVLTVEAVVPPVSGRKALAAAKYAVEDQVSVDPTDLHVALGPARSGAPQRTVSAVALTKMQEWMDSLAALGVAPDVLVPDYLVLPGDGITVWDLKSRVAVRTGPEAGFTLEPDMVPVVLQAALINSGAVKANVASDTPSRLAPAGGWGEMQVNEDSAPTLQDLALAAATAAPVNLLQGAFKPARQTGDGFRPWRRAAVMAAGLAILWVAFTAIEGLRYSRAADDAYAEAERIFRDAFPDVRRVVDPRAQARSALGASAASGFGFLQLAAVLTDGLQAAGDIEVQALRFDPNRGELTATLSYDRFSALDDLRAAVANRGALMTEGGSRQADGRVIGDITMVMP